MHYAKKVKRLDLMNLETSILHIIIVQVITGTKVLQIITTRNLLHHILQRMLECSSMIKIGKNSIKPFQKHHVVNAFPEFKKFKFKKHINLQLGSGIDKLFESLLNNNTLNPKGKYKSVSGLCQSWGKKV